MKTTNEHSSTENNEINMLIEPANIIRTDVKAAEQSLTVPEGYVLLTALNEDGSDMPGTDFFYPESKYKRYFGDETKFRVKKKLN